MKIINLTRLDDKRFWGILTDPDIDEAERADKLMWCYKKDKGPEWFTIDVGILNNVSHDHTAHITFG